MQEQENKQDQPLYAYMYDSLVSQLECGAFPEGQPLPSQQQLCRQFNVGITTVRKVIKLLEKNGYIKTALGRQAVVIYRTSPETYIAALAGRREEIADAFQGLRMLLPSLYEEGARRCGEQELRTMQKAIDGITDDMDLPTLYRQTNLFFHALIRPFHNPLIMDLELDAENYLHIPYIAVPEMKNPFDLSAGRIKAWLQAVTDSMAAGDYDGLDCRFERMYGEAAQRVDAYLQVLAKYAPAAPQTDERIHWFRAKGRSELYIRLALSLLQRISCGEFDGKKYLPSIPRLMEEYGVIKDTASRALTLLNTLGVAQTIDKKGSVLRAGVPESGRSTLDLSDPVIRQRLSYFLGALQIIAITAPVCAAAIPVDKQWFSDMKKRLGAASRNEFSILSVHVLTGMLMQLAPCHSLQNIYRQLHELMLWGYYLQRVDESFYPDPCGMGKSMADVVRAFELQGQAALPDALGRAFSQLYQDMRHLISQLPNGADLIGISCGK